MKIFDSGMPEEAYWNSLFDVPLIVNWLDLGKVSAPVVEVGCGYGTFTVPVASKTPSEVYAFDIEPSMIETAKKNARGISNVHFYLRDVLERGTGLESDTAGLVLLFNILHFAERRILLEEACRVLKDGGVAAIVHWRKDIQTPRGPSPESRPDLTTILDSIQGLDLRLDGSGRILEPYHWGVKLVKTDAETSST